MAPFGLILWENAFRMIPDISFVAIEPKIDKNVRQKFSTGGRGPPGQAGGGHPDRRAGAGGRKGAGKRHLKISLERGGAGERS